METLYLNSFFGKNVQIACDKEDGIIFIASDKYIYKYNIKSDQIEKMEVKKGQPYKAGEAS